MEHLLDIQSYKGRPEHETDHFLRQFDTNCVPDHERIARAHARGQARELMDWMSTKFALDGFFWRELAEKWSVYHMMSVVNFQKYLEEHGKNTKNKLTSSQVARQFYWCCMKVPESTVGNIRDTEMQSVAWPWPREYKVTYSTKPIKANWETGERIFVVYRWQIHLHTRSGGDGLALIRKGFTDADIAYSLSLGEPVVG
jgi:hypothetical protein